MQTNYLSIIPVISKFEIPKGFGVIDKNVQNRDRSYVGKYGNLWCSHNYGCSTLGRHLAWKSSTRYLTHSLIPLGVNVPGHLVLYHITCIRKLINFNIEFEIDQVCTFIQRLDSLETKTFHGQYENDKKKYQEKSNQIIPWVPFCLTTFLAFYRNLMC